MFSVAVQLIDDRIVVRLSGELDLSTVAQLHRVTDELVTGGRDLHFDLRELTFIDSTGLTYFVQLNQSGRAFTLGRPRPTVFRSFQITTLDRLLPWADD